MPECVIERTVANEELVREHARRGGFPPPDVVSKVSVTIDPTTAET